MSKFPRLVMSTVLLLMVWGTGLSETAAQESETIQETEPKTTPASSAIGLLDVGHVVKNYPRFLDSMAELKLDFEKAKEKLELKKGELENLEAQLQIHPVGTDEHMTLEDRIAALKSELTNSVARQKKVFVRREAQVYHDAYQDIVEQSEQHARQNGIVMVFRFSSEKPNVNDPPSVLKKINRPIVWYDEDRDITKAVLQRLVERWKEKVEEASKAEDEELEAEEEGDEEESPAEEPASPTPNRPANDFPAPVVAE